MLFEMIALWYSLLHDFNMTFKDQKLLLFILKSSQNKVASNIAITGKKEKRVRHKIYGRGILR